MGTTMDPNATTLAATAKVTMTLTFKTELTMDDPVKGCASGKDPKSVLCASMGTAVATTVGDGATAKAACVCDPEPTAATRRGRMLQSAQAVKVDTVITATAAQASAKTADELATASVTTAAAVIKKVMEDGTAIEGMSAATFTAAAPTGVTATAPAAVTTVAPPAPSPAATTSSAYATVLSVGTIGTVALSMMF